MQPVPRFPFPAREALDLDPRFAELRDGPIAPVELPYGGRAWLATRHADVRQVMADPRFSRAATVAADIPRQVPQMPDTRTLLELDPPEHHRMRRLVAGAFNARRVAQLVDDITAVVHTLVDALVEQGPPADFLTAVARPLPMTMICSLLGVPLADRERFTVWTESLLAVRRLTPEEFEQVRHALDGYLAELVRHRRAGGPDAGGDDVLAALVRARDEDGALTEQELVSFGVHLLAAGFESTASHLTNSLWLLLTEPGLWGRLRAEPGLVPTTVEELLRFVPLNNGAGMPRVATADIPVGEVVVPAGATVYASTIAANRDAAVFADAERFEPERATNPHLAFGHGVHHCLGSQLVRAELGALLTVLPARLPGLALAVAPGDVRWRSQSVARAPEALPLTW